MLSNQCLSVMRFTCLELWRVKLWWFLVLLILLGCAAAEFGAAIAITESSNYRIVFYAAGIRIAAVFVAILLVTSSVLRDIHDKIVALSLSRAVSRADWFVGKLLAYIIASSILALAVSIPVIVQAPVAGMVWTCSLVFELALVAAAALTCATSLRHITMVISAVCGFYLLARNIAAMVLMSTSGLVDLSLISNRFIAAAVHALAYVLPDLDRYSQSVWLTEKLASPLVLLSLSAQTLIYIALLAAVGLYDCYRRDF